MMAFVTNQISRGNNSIIGMNVSPDQENSSINILHFSQSGLGLPDRDYYFKTDSATLGIQNAYKTYLATLFSLTGSSHEEAQKSADAVYAIEKSLLNLIKHELNAG